MQLLQREHAFTGRSCKGIPGCIGYGRGHYRRRGRLKVLSPPQSCQVHTYRWRKERRKRRSLFRKNHLPKTTLLSHLHRTQHSSAFAIETLIPNDRTSYKPPAGYEPISFDPDCPHFDWDTVNNDPNLELWAIRLPSSVRTFQAFSRRN